MNFIDFHTHLHIRLDDADQRRLKPCHADPLLPLFHRLIWGAFEKTGYHYLLKPGSPFERPMERILARIMRAAPFDPANGTPAPDEQTLERRLDKAGIDRAVVLPVPPVSRNADVIATCRGNPRFIPFFSPDTHSDEPLDRQLAGALRDGARGLKIHPLLQNLPLSGDTVRVTAAFAERNGIPLVIHAGGSRALFNLCDGIRPVATEFSTLANRFPGLNLVAAHTGLWEWRTYLAAAAKAPNLFLDISFQSAEVIRAALAVAGPRRLLFGSDFPMGNATIVRHNLTSLGLDDDTLMLIGRGNALRLLGEAPGS